VHSIEGFPNERRLIIGGLKKRQCILVVCLSLFYCTELGIRLNLGLFYFITK